MPQIKLFTKPISIGDQTLHRPLNFYVGLNKIGVTDICNLIRQYGGNIAKLPAYANSNVIVLTDPCAKVSNDEKPVYSVQYIQDCIEENKLLDLEKYRVTPAKSSSRKNKNKNQTHTYTSPINKGNEQNQHQHDSIPSQDHISPNVQTQMDEIQTVNENVIRSPRNEKNFSAMIKTENIEEQETNGIDMNQARERDTERSGELQQISDQETDTESNLVEQENQHEKTKWTSDEDAKLIHLFAETTSSYRDKDIDLEQVLQLACWIDMEKQNFLPENRNATECLERIKFIRSNQVHGSQQLKENEDSSPKRQRSKSNLDVAENEKRHRRQREESGDGSASGMRRESYGRRRSALGSSVTPENRKSDAEAQVHRLVKRLARRGNTSRRHAFRVLRAQRGNWKTALSVIRRRQQRGKLENH